MQINGVKTQNMVSHSSIQTPKQTNTGKTEMFEEMFETTKVAEKKDDGVLSQMIDNIETLKKVLDMELTVDNLKKYKDAVQSFVEHYTKNELKMEDHILSDRKGYQKKVSIIRSIDQKINNLNQNMLESPLGHIETLKQIGEIQGLVVNLLI
jgi:uncharacterized protein YaaR (DUF327 family)